MLKIFLLIVVGLAGDPEHGALFHKWGTSLAESAVAQGVTADRLVYLVDAPAEGDAQVTGRSTREAVTAALDGFAKAASPDDLVVVMLIGHGTFDGRTARFNLPGPDMTAADFAAPIGKLPARQVVVVNAASSSGPFVEALSGPGRTIITATRSGAEQYAPLFGGYFVDALTSAAADTDKNQRVSLLEAFAYAKAQVGRAYEREGLLVVEHAILDDNGDGKGSADPSMTAEDGKVAAIVSLGSTHADDLPADPVVRALYVERRDLERRVEALRLLKSNMDPARYTSQLEQLVTAIALKTREIRAAEQK